MLGISKPEDPEDVALFPGRLDAATVERNGLPSWAFESDVCESDSTVFANGFAVLAADGNDAGGFANGFDSGAGLAFWKGLVVGVRADLWKGFDSGVGLTL